MSSKQAKKDADSMMKKTVVLPQLLESEAKKKKKVPKQQQQQQQLELDRSTSELAELKALPTDPEMPVKAKSEIDDIFGVKKRKKTEDDDRTAQMKKENANSEVVKLNSRGELVRPKKKKNPEVAEATKATPAAATPTSRKRTEDGFTVYSAEELGFDKKNAGGTKLCPFDCDCCF